MTEEELLAIVDAEFTSAQGAPDGEISTERAKAWRYYLSRPLGNEVEGESSVVSSDVADVVDGIMPSLLRIFTIAENLVDFNPTGPDDVEKARQESDYVNHVFFQKNPAFLILYTWFFDALTQKNGIVKAWWDDSEVVTTEKYQNLSPGELTELMDDEELEPVEQEERTIELNPQLAMSAGYTEEAAEAIQAIQQAVSEGKQIEEPPKAKVKVHDVVFKRTTKKGQARVEPVPPDEYRISGNARSLDPSGARMVGHEREVTRSELLEMGFDKSIVEDLPVDGQTDSPEKRSRQNKTDEERNTPPNDKSQDKILVREAYIKVDFDDDGKSELRQVIWAGNKILTNDEADRQPFHVISPQPLPHKHFGRATAEKVMDIQEVNTTLTRQVLNNLYRTNQPGHAVWEQGIGENTLDDLLTTRVGRVARFSRPVGDSYQPMTVPFTAGATFPMLEFFDKVKRDRTGVNADGEGLTPEQLKNIQTTVMSQANDLSRMKVEAVVRIFAETGIKSLFLHIHELLLKHQSKEEIVLLRNKWTQVDPREWRTRRDMTVRIGLGIGTRDQNLIHLNAIWDKQMAILGAGGAEVLVTARDMFNTASEVVRNANLQTPGMFFTDPGDKKFSPPGGDELAKQQMQLQQRQQQLDGERQQIASAKLQLQAQEQQIEAQRERMQLQLDAAELERKREADQNTLLIAMENIATKLTELELQYATNVPGAKT